MCKRRVDGFNKLESREQTIHKNFGDYVRDLKYL